jgi:hypothetical protein
MAVMFFFHQNISLYFHISKVEDRMSKTSLTSYWVAWKPAIFFKSHYTLSPCMPKVVFLFHYGSWINKNYRWKHDAVRCSGDILHKFQLLLYGLSLLLKQCTTAQVNRLHTHFILLSCDLSGCKEPRAPFSIILPFQSSIRVSNLPCERRRSRSTSGLL